MSKNRKTVNDPKPAFSRMDYLAILPAVFMCLLIIAILMMDLVIPGMSNEQYQDFPALYRLTHAAIVCAGILFWFFFLRQNGLLSLSPRSMLRMDTVYILFFAVFLLLVIVSTIVNGLDEKAVHGVSFRNIGIFHLFAFFLIYCFLSSKIRRQRFRTGIFVLYISIADFIGLATLVDQFIVPIEAFGAKKELSAIFFNGNHYGYYLTMAVLAAAGLFIYYSDFGYRVFGLLSMLFNCLLLALNNSLGCMLAVALTFVLFLIVCAIANKPALKPLLLLFAGLLVFELISSLAAGGISNGLHSLLEDIHAVAGGGDVAATAGHNRWLLWTQTADYILQRPMLGYGCEGISDMLMADTGRGNPHNELLCYAAYFGIPAAVAYTLGMITAFSRFFRSKVLSDPTTAAAGMAATGYFISSLFGVPMFYTSPFFFIFLGLSMNDQ